MRDMGLEYATHLPGPARQIEEVVDTNIENPDLPNHDGQERDLPGPPPQI